MFSTGSVVHFQFCIFLTKDELSLSNIKKLQVETLVTNEGSVCIMFVKFEGSLISINFDVGFSPLTFADFSTLADYLRILFSAVAAFLSEKFFRCSVADFFFLALLFGSSTLFLVSFSVINALRFLFSMKSSCTHLSNLTQPFLLITTAKNFNHVAKYEILFGFIGIDFNA